MSQIRRRAVFLAVIFSFVATVPLDAQQSAIPAWSGVLKTSSGEPISGATVRIASRESNRAATTQTTGAFHIDNVLPGVYKLTVETAGRVAVCPHPISVSPGTALITLAGDNTVEFAVAKTETAATGGQDLSSQAVSELPLNKRDFSTLLLLAAGTMTDSNGANNFTQQFAINGQRGVEAVFSMDDADVTDPEIGGATFTNFNVDAVQEIRSSSGWMPAEIGRGAAGYSNIITRSGASGFHGSFFEFLRNSSLDARNYFDHPSPANPGRIPPFRRNEFGFTNGGPVVIPGVYDGRGRTFYFGQYQGFRQVLGTTQVIPVPTAQERSGVDTTAFPGDTLTVPVDPEIAKVLARYPLPNYPQGAYGVHTYATSSNVKTNADQFSVRIDHKLNDQTQLFFRVSFDNLDGPTTNPDQTVLDPTFAVRYVDHQRNVAASYARVFSPHFSMKTIFGIIRTTPIFRTTNHTDPALKFNDGLFEAFNAPAGSVMSAFGNVFQLTQTFAYTTGKHQWAWGGEARINRDTTYFGTSPNGEYDFGGGVAYSPVDIPSASGLHDIHVGDPLPDTLSSLLTGSPFAYSVAVASPGFSSGAHIGPAAINRNAYAMYLQDAWKISDRFLLSYGLRYELYSPIAERAKRTSSLRMAGADQVYMINPQPGYEFRKSGFGPRVQLTTRITNNLEFHAGGAITTIPPNIWQDNYLTGSTPFVVYPRLIAAPGAPIRYGFQITPDQLPLIYTTSGQEILTDGNSKAVPANTIMDVNRYEQDLAALSPDHRVTALDLSSISPHFGNGYLETWTAGLERRFGNITADVSYMGTAGVKLPRVTFPNAYQGASPAFAPYTEFDAAGNVIGGFGVEQVVTDTSHSTYHALQTSLNGQMGKLGPGVQASYTWSKSIDDTSTVAGGTGATGAISIAYPQDPFNTQPERGPSTFDVTHAFSLSVAQDLHIDSMGFLSWASKKATKGWTLLSISSLNTGLPFTVYSGVQQTGAGSIGADRPDLIETPQLSTGRSVPEDYFGRGANNASFFYIPVNVTGGTGPNQGRFGTLGRNSFRGPAFKNFDFSLIKDTPLGTRANGAERMALQFRAEFFNLFNIVNFGLPANVIKGSGFGVISKTANNSRQIQFSLKLIY